MNKYLVIDTETTNGFDDPMVYDLGGVVVDELGNVYDSFSFVIDEVFNGEPELMAEAFFADKIPQYREDIANGVRKVVPMVGAKCTIKAICEKYDVKAIMAHNMRFDYRSTTRTQRFLTKSKFRFFLPYGIELWDTMVMAEDTICKLPQYKEFCKANGYTYGNNKCRKTAEVLYRFISGNNEFEEKHTGIDDVMIEKEIFRACMEMNPTRKKCFE